MLEARPPPPRRSSHLLSLSRSPELSAMRLRGSRGPAPRLRRARTHSTRQRARWARGFLRPSVAARWDCAVRPRSEGGWNERKELGRSRAPTPRRRSPRGCCGHRCHDGEDGNGDASARKQRRAVEQDRRGHGRRLGCIPDRGLPVHGVRVDRGLRRGRGAEPWRQAAPPAVPRLPGCVGGRCRRRGGVSHTRPLLPRVGADARRVLHGSAHRDPERLVAPIGSTSAFSTLPAGPGVYRLTPPYQTPQTPWIANMTPFVLKSASQFMPGPPPALSSQEWVDAFNELKTVGGASSTVRT